MNDTAAEASVRGAGGGTDEFRARREVIPFDSPAEDEEGFHVRTHRRPVHQRRRLRQGQSLTRLRLLVFPLIAGETGQEPAFARLPDIGLDLRDCTTAPNPGANVPRRNGNRRHRLRVSVRT